MSPEQAEGARVGPASDVFSLGCVIVFAATGRGPFGSGPQASMLYRVVHAEPALDEVPGGLRELAAACLAKAPADRPGLAALVEATAAERTPDEGDALATFWPVPVTGLIRSHQARLTTQMRERTAAPHPEPGTTEPHAPQTGTTGVPEPPVPEPPVPEPSVPSATALQPAAAGAAVEGQDPHRPTPRPTVLATAPAGPAPVAGPAMPADRVTAGAPAGAMERGVARRRVLIGLAVVAGAGLAGAGWELSRGNSPRHATGGGRPTSPAPRASTPRSTPSPHTATRLWGFDTGGIVTAIALGSGTVFAGNDDGNVYALRASDGKRLWKFTTGAKVQSKIAAADGAIYAGSDDESVYALRASDGKRLWEYSTGGSVESQIAVADGAVYAGSSDETLWRLRASDGLRLWADAILGITGIVVAGGTIYLGDSAHVRAVRASDGLRLWDFPAPAAGWTGIAVAGGIVYASNAHTVYALRASDGRRLWDFQAGGLVESQIAVAGGAVYAGSNDDKVYALRASDGKRLWEYTTGGSVASGITVADGIVYAGSNDYKVRALRASDGSELWNFATDGPVESQIAAAGRTVYAGSNDGKVYALTG